MIEFMKPLYIRLDDKLAKKFDKICQKVGLKKNAVVTHMIESFVRKHSSKKNQIKNIEDDPIIKVIGIIKSGPLLTSPEDIDKVVYGL